MPEPYRHTTMSVRLPLELIEQIDAYAEKKDWSRSKVIREACAQMIRQRTRKCVSVKATKRDGVAGEAKRDGVAGAEHEQGEDESP